MNDKKKALGRGLDSLLPAARATTTGGAAVPPGIMKGEAVLQLELGKIDRNPYQTRSGVDENALNELAASIRVNGVLQPIVVRPGGDGRYQLIAGERRWMASERAGRQTVPALVRQVSNEQAMELTIIENLQREDLNPLEQAKAFDRLGREFGLTQEQMAQRTGKDRSTVSNYLRILKLPQEVQLGLNNGKLSFGHAKALMMLDSTEAILGAVIRVLRDSLSVRQTEDLVHNIIQPPEKTAEKEELVDPNVREAEKELERALGVKVTIKDRKGKGRIILQYASLDDFDRILEALGK